jgi:PAS domain S-box-containing protein
LAAASTLVPLAFGLAGLAAWFTGRLRLASFHTEFIPMAPGTAVALVLMSAALFAVAFGRGAAPRRAVRAAALIVSTLAFVELVEFFAGVSAIDWEAFLIPRAGTFGAVSLARMSPLTAATLALVGVALGCLTNVRSPAASDFGGVLGSLAVLVGGTVALGYAYGAPLLYGGEVIPMALTTGLAFMGTGVALVALAGPASLPLRPFSGVTRAHGVDREFRALFAANPLPMWIYDLTTLQFLEVNDAAVRRYGYERDEFLALTIKDVRPPEDVEGLLAHLGGRRDAWRASGSWRHRLKSGEIIDVEVTSHTITFAGRTAALVVAQDITERKRSVEALQTAEERTRYALESANVGIWDMDYATGLLRWSETMETHYGIQPGSFGGTFEAFLDRVHPDDRASVIEAIEGAVTSGTDFSVQNRSIWPDGTVRWLTGAGRVLLGENSEPVRAVGISLDVTDRRTLEAQFQQAQKMEAVGRLAGGVAHDFNNLLTVILGFCELLLADRDPNDPRQADVVEIQEIQKAGMRAAELTRQLLAFSRKQIIEPRLLDLNEVLVSLQGMLGRLIGEDVTIALNLRPDLAFVKADRGQVEQVVMNLAVNARDAMPMGGTLTIETANAVLDARYAKTHVAVKPGPHVALTVTDTGTGMTPEVQARLFEPFFTTKESGKGTGLGLATVYGIVTRSGGSVVVQSEVGKGTAIRVYFPKADASEWVVSSPAHGVRPRAGTQTVLVVDDEQGLRELARRLLRRLGYTVLVAADADEALQLFEGSPSIDVLLTDVVMPGASGPELTKRLIEQRPALKVIYMSGYAEDAIAQHGVLEPGIAFLNKPFTSETLGQKLREVLDA